MSSPLKFDITVQGGGRPPVSAVAIPSKSELHRLLIACALSDAPTRIECSRPMRSQDIDATADCLTALGAGISFGDTYIDVRPIERIPDSPLLNCRESGSTLRFMLPVAAALGANATFIGTGRLPERPLGDLTAVMKAHGVSFSAEKLPFTLGGRLSAGFYEISGGVSSQYITGLLFALSLIDEDRRKLLEEEREETMAVVRAMRRSAPYSELYRALSELPTKRSELTESLERLLIAISDLIMLKNDKNAPLSFFHDRKEAAEIADSIASARLFGIYECINSAHDGNLKNANTTALITSLSAGIKMA